MKYKYQNRGFTLVEVVIYLAIFSIVLSGFVYFAVLVNKLGVKNKVNEEVSNGARFASFILDQKIRTADSIQAPAAAATGTSLILETDGATSTFYLDAGTLKYGNGSGILDVTNANIIVSGLEFANLSFREQENIGYEFNISFNGADSLEYVAERHIRSAATLR